MKIQRRHLLMAAGALLGVALLGLLAVLGAYLYVRPSLPPVGVLKEVQLQEPMRVYTRDGLLITEFGEQKRAPMAWDDIPRTVIDAFLAAEDDRFFSHPGVDYQGLIRAGINHLVTGDRSQGGGTITMQLAREFFLTREKTYIRKLREIFLAFRIENELSKEEILTLYLNKIFLGNRAYGVAAAAQVYYGVDARDLTLPQAAGLAATAQRPSENNPLTATTRFMERRAYVLGRLNELGWIDEASYRTAMAAPNIVTLHTVASEVEAPYVAEMVRADMLQRYGLDAYTLGLRVHTTVESVHQRAANRALRTALHEYDFRHGYRGPLRQVELDDDDDDEAAWDALLADVRRQRLLVPALVIDVGETEAVAYLGRGERAELHWTAMAWARRQLEGGGLAAPPREASDVVARGDIVLLVETEEGWRLSQVPEVQGALVAVDTDNGAVLALTGGYDFSSSQFNRAAQATRQPGSAFKPFIYSAALERGFTPATVVNDAPVVFEDDEALERDWRPRNDTGRFYGPTRLREALTHSRNLVSVRVLRAIGPGYAVNYLNERFGFDRSRLPRDLSLSLGSGAISPLEMAVGYAVFANGGHRVAPWLLSRVEDADGAVLWEADPAVVCPVCEKWPVIEDGSDLLVDLVLPRPAERVLDPRIAFIMDDMLRGVVRNGTGRDARVIGRSDLAGKTGSTNEHHDAWFVGYGGGVSAAAWVGHDQLRQLGTNEYGGRAALPMWIEFMRTALDGVPEVETLQPPGIVMARISPETGMLVDADAEQAMFEYFREEDLARLETDIRAVLRDEGEDDEERDETILF